jgi:hypothetical protein
VSLSAGKARLRRRIVLRPGEGIFGCFANAFDRAG